MFLYEHILFSSADPTWWENENLQFSDLIIFLNKTVRVEEQFIVYLSATQKTSTKIIFCMHLFPHPS